MNPFFVALTAVVARVPKHNFAMGIDGGGLVLSVGLFCRAVKMGRNGYGRTLEAKGRSPGCFEPLRSEFQRHQFSKRQRAPLREFPWLNPFSPPSRLGCVRARNPSYATGVVNQVRVQIRLRFITCDHGLWGNL